MEEALDRDVLFAVAEKLIYSPNFYFDNHFSSFNNHFSSSKLVDFMVNYSLFVSSKAVFSL